jgi:hypothetical protein
VLTIGRYSFGKIQIVDGKVLEFALAPTCTPGDFTIKQQRRCWLNPQMAKSLVKHVAGTEFVGGVKTFCGAWLNRPFD